MNKHAQAVIEEPGKTRSATSGTTSADKEALYLKLKREAEIRQQLEEFAREFALARAERASR